MTLTTAVTDGYRSATDRLAATDWTRLAAAVVAVQLATALWYLYVALLAFDGENDIATLSLGITDLWNTAITGLIIGTFLAPVLVAAFLVLSRILPIRRVYAQTAAPWLLLGPGVVLALIGYGLYDLGLESIRMAFEAEGWEYAKWSGLWFLYTGILATFAGGAYALVTGSIRPTERQRRGLIVAVAVLVALPMIAGAAFPMDDGSDTDPDVYTGGDRDGLETAPDETDDDRDRGENQTETDRDDPLDAETYDNGDRSPFIFSVTPLEGESDAVTVTDDARPPETNETWREHGVAETHTDAAVTVSDVNATVSDGSVVPKARYYLEFEGMNTSTDRVIGLETYGTVEAAGHNDDADQPNVWTGGVVEADGGFYLEMERTESTHVYVDTITDDGEVHRYVAELGRDDV